MAVAAAVAGLALAAGTGALPTPLTTTGGRAPAVADRPGTGPAAGLGGNRGPVTDGSTASASASWVYGRCVAYVAQERTQPRQARDNPAFAELIRLAGGGKRVGEYCARVLGLPVSTRGKGGRGAREDGRPSPPADGADSPKRTPAGPTRGPR
jgi:hypothetical protein